MHSPCMYYVLCISLNGVALFKDSAGRLSKEVVDEECDGRLVVKGERTGEACMVYTSPSCACMIMSCLQLGRVLQKMHEEAI